MNALAENFETLTERFYRDGYIIVEDVFSADEVALMAEAFDRLVDRAEQLNDTTMVNGSQFVVDREDAFTRIHRVVWCGACEPILDEFGEDARLVELAAALLGTVTMDHLINQAHFKQPGDEVVFDWHQDSRHRRYGTPLWEDVDGRGSFVQILVAVDENTIENGPVKVIPNSHLQGHIDCGVTKKIPPELYDEDAAIPVLLKPGSLVVFGPYLIHGSGPNLSSGSRRVFINGFSVPGANARVYPGEGAGRRVRVGRRRRWMKEHVGDESDTKYSE